MLKTPALQAPANVQSKRQIWNTLLAMYPKIIYVSQGQLVMLGLRSQVCHRMDMVTSFIFLVVFIYRPM